MGSVLKIRDENGQFIDIPAIKGDAGKSAYEQAVEGGFQGTEEEFIQVLASLSSALQLQLLELGDEAGEYLETHIGNRNNPHGVTAQQIDALKIYYSFAALNKALGTNFDVTTPIETIIQAMPDNTGLIGDVNSYDKEVQIYPVVYGTLCIYKIRANRVIVEYVSNISEGIKGYNKRWVGQYTAGAFGGFKEVFTEAHPPTAEQVGAMPEKVLIDGKDILSLTKDGWYYSTTTNNVPTDEKSGYVRVMTNTNGDYRVITWQPRDGSTEYSNVLFEGRWLGWSETLTNPFTKTLTFEGDDITKPIVIKNKNSYYALEKYRTVDGRPCRMDVGLGVYPSAVLQVAIGKKGDSEAPEQYTHRIDVKYDGIDFTYKDENNAEVKNKMFGEHNKPVGSYTGDGAAERHITTGGIGNAIAVWSSADYDFGALIMPSGAMYFRGGNLQVSGKNICYFENGSLHIYGNAIAFNDNNRTYNYQVL